MSDTDCHQCQNVVFAPALDGSSPVEFQAKIHPDQDSLERCAAKRTCHLCTVLRGMLENRKRFSPVKRQADSPVGTSPGVSLWLYYRETGDDEGSDDWEFLEDESHTEDAPRDVSFLHALGSEDIRIRNPGVISRSAWYTEEPPGPGKQAETSRAAAPCPGLLDMSTGSDASMGVARGWIETCRNKHTNCGKRSTEAGYTPTRLLDVSQAVDKSNGIVTLVETTKNEIFASSHGTGAAEYATLSHRWNPSYTYFTETSNINQHLTRGIQIGLLPRTFAEACITVRKLGLRYIWIDSLCIIQDSDADKAAEIPKMADYYQSAELNLSASTECLGGLWSDRDGAATRPFTIKATLCLPGGKREKEVVLELAPVLRTNKSHLDYRGWILQERIFPRRTLFFDAYWLSFECGEMSLSESCPQGVRLDASSNRLTVEGGLGTELDRDCTLSIIGGVVRSMDPASPITTDTEIQRQVLVLWYRILNEYSLRQLSFESDRLDAISGLAARLACILGDEYIGGIWRRSLLECLQWRPDDPLRGSEATVRQAAYRAPTWSWASCELLPRSTFRDARRALPLQISNDFVADGGAASEAAVEVLDVAWRCAGANRFGSLAEARLTLLGRPLRGFAYVGRAPDLGLDMLTLREEEIEEMPEQRAPGGGGDDRRTRELAWIHIAGKNRQGELARMITMVSPDTSDHRVEGGGVYLLPLARRYLPGSGDSLFCLVLKEVGPERYERIGHSVTRSCYAIKAAKRKMELV